MVLQVSAFVFGLALLSLQFVRPVRSSLWMAVSATLIIWSVASLLVMWRRLHVALIVAVPLVLLLLGIVPREDYVLSRQGTAIMPLDPFAQLEGVLGGIRGRRPGLGHARDNRRPIPVPAHQVIVTERACFQPHCSGLEIEAGRPAVAQEQYQLGPQGWQKQAAPAPGSPEAELQIIQIDRDSIEAGRGWLVVVGVVLVLLAAGAITLAVLTVRALLRRG